MPLNFKTKLYQASSLICLVGLGIPGIAFADDVSQPQAVNTAQAPAAGNGGIGEIVVTANKRSQSINKVGMTIKALSGDTLQQENLTTLSDLAKAVTGLTFTESENGTPVYTLRGVGFNETSLAAYPDISVYLDQAPLPIPAETELTLFDIERVEVLKGPQGTLFGNNATGGAINYIANKPTPNFSAGADLSYGRFNTAQLDGFVSGPITDSLLGRIAFSAEGGDGWQHSQTRDDTTGKPDKFAARMILDWQATDDLHFELNINGWHDGSQPQQAQFVKFLPSFPPPAHSPAINAPIGPNDNSVADWPAVFEPRADNGLFQSTLRTDYDLTDTIKLTSITDFIYYSRNERPDTGGTQFVNEAITRNVGDVTSFAQELRLAGGGTGPFRWLTGLNFSSDDTYEVDTDTYFQGTAFTEPLFPGAAGSSYDSKQHMENYAAFVNGEYDLFDQVTLKGGVRFTEADRAANNCASYYRGTPLDPNGAIFNFLSATSSFLSGQPFTPASPDHCFMIAPATAPIPFGLTRFYGKLNQNNVSYHGGVDWKPADNVLVFANISRGYKAGSFPAIAGSIDASVAAVTQESVTDYEIGFKTQLFDRHLTFNGTGFYYTYDDKQLKARLIDPLFGILDALVNVPQSSVRGAEFEVHGRPLEGLDIGADATYLDATVDTFTGVNQDGQVQNFAGSAVPFTPKLQLAGNINYEHPINDQLLGFLGAQVTYRTTTTASVGSPKFFTLPSYSVLDLQAGVETQDGRWRAFVWGKNVADTFYLNNVIQIEDGIVRYTGLPATYGITVAFRY